nr:ABC transporter permease [Mycobacterium sp. OTB74]
MIAARAGTGLLLAALVSAVALLALAARTGIADPVRVIAGTVMFALIYLAIGALIAVAVPNPVNGAVAILFIWMLDVFFGPGGSGGDTMVSRFFPTHFVTLWMVDLPSHHAGRLGDLGISLAWVLGALVVAAIVLHRGRPDRSTTAPIGEPVPDRCAVRAGRSASQPGAADPAGGRSRGLRPDGQSHHARPHPGTVGERTRRRAHRIVLVPRRARRGHDPHRHCLVVGVGRAVRGRRQRPRGPAPAAGRLSRTPGRGGTPRCGRRGRRGHRDRHTDRDRDRVRCPAMGGIHRRQPRAGGDLRPGGGDHRTVVRPRRRCIHRLSDTVPRQRYRAKPDAAPNAGPCGASVARLRVDPRHFRYRPDRRLRPVRSPADRGGLAGRARCGRRGHSDAGPLIDLIATPRSLPVEAKRPVPQGV